MSAETVDLVAYCGGIGFLIWIICAIARGER
jgi:hypothetical protein